MLWFLATSLVSLALVSNAPIQSLKGSLSPTPTRESTYEAPCAQDATFLPFIGHIHAPHTVLIFTDPYCAFCHESLEECERYVKKHPDIKIVIHDMPVGGKDSVLATEALLVAHQEGRHASMRKALQKAITKKARTLTLPELIALAGRLGIHTHHFETRMKSKAVQAQYKHILSTASRYKIDATPSFVIFVKGRPHKEEGKTPPEELAKQLGIP